MMAFTPLTVNFLVASVVSHLRHALGAGSERAQHLLCCNASLASELLRCSRQNVSWWKSNLTIALLTLVTPEIEEYAAYTVAINTAYAGNFKHTFFVANASSRLHVGGQLHSAVWRAGNVAAALDFLEAGAHGAQWVAWLDADAAFVDFGPEDALQRLIRERASSSTHILINRGELIGPGASSMFNSGFVLFRRHPWTILLLQRWWTELASGLENDQEVLERFYRSNTLDAKTHIVALPQGQFYSEIGDPIRACPAEQHLVHLAGVPKEVRRGVFSKFWSGLCGASAASATARGPHGSSVAEVHADMVSPHSTALQRVYMDEMGSFLKSYSTTESVHEEICGAIDPNDVRSCLEVAERLAFGLRRRGRVAEATLWAQNALNGRTMLLGPLDEDTLSSHVTVADAAQGAGNLEDACNSLSKALTGRRIVYGRNHRATLLVEARLGEVLRIRGHVDEADGHTAFAATMFAASMGADHPSTISVLSSLALLRQQQGRYKEAATVYKSAAHGASRSLGREHTSTIQYQQGAVDALIHSGQTAEAESLARKLIRKRRSAGGPNLALALESLAAALHNPGDETPGESAVRPAVLNERASLLREAAEVYAKTHGRGFHKAIACMRSIAEIKQKQGLFQEAAQWFTTALSDANLAGKMQYDPQNMFGSATHKATVASIANNFGMFLRRLEGTKRLDEAEELLRIAAEGFHNSVGPADASSWRASSNLADLLRQRGRHSEALPLARVAYEGMRKLGPPARGDALIAESNFALAMYASARIAEAETLYRNLLRANREVYGAHSKQVASTRADLQVLLSRMGRHVEAERLTRRVEL